MRKLLVVLALLLAGSGVAYADGLTQTVDATTLARTVRTVFNNAGSALTSGSVVVWDNDKVSFDRSGYPYVTTTTTADMVWVAGVTIEDSCPDQNLCSIVTEGPAITNIAQNTDVIAEDTLVATTTVAGQAGDYGPAANTCALGISMELREAYTGATTSLGISDLKPMWVYVHPSCQ